MLSGELAELAGVTVRTLRHYHQIGVLPEPPRSAGGYRHYDVRHVVRLLRITRMTALGVPLAALPEVLDDPEATGRLLDELDRQAVAEIDRLTARRASIAALRRTGAPADLPPEASTWRSGPAAGTPADMARYEHDQLILAGLFLGPHSAAGFAALFGEAGGAPEASAALTARFYALDAATPDAEIASLVDELVAQLEPVTARLAAVPALEPRAVALMDELSGQSLRPVQHRVLRRVQQRLAAAGSSPRT